MIKGFSLSSLLELEFSHIIASWNKVLGLMSFHNYIQKSLLPSTILSYLNGNLEYD